MPTPAKLRCWILQHVSVPQVIDLIRNGNDVEVQQGCFIDAVHVLLQDPCNLPYARRLLTECIAYLQQQRIDPSDAIADVLASTLLSAAPDTGWRVKTLYYGAAANDTMVLCTAVGLLEGATGCHDWEAGFRLAEVLLSQPSLVAGKRVMELGCGCGMVGIAAHRSGARSLWLTDGNDDAVANCIANLQRNGVPVMQSTPADAGDASVLCWRMPWEAAGTPSSMRPELVLAADVLYDPEVVPVLLRLLRQLLVGGGGEALLATRIRNEATLQGFVQQVPEHGLTVCQVEGAWDSVRFCHLAALDINPNSIVFHLVKPAQSL